MHDIPFDVALRVWARIGLESFGGPAGQIAVMHRVVVDEEKWVSEERFLHALNYCMLLPGPAAMQLSVYLGWLLHGARGGIAAGILFVFPGWCAVLALSAAYAVWHDVAFVNAALFGLKAAVLSVVLEAVIRIGRRALLAPGRVAITAAAFVALFLFEVPVPAVVGVAALLGLATRGGPAPTVVRGTGVLDDMLDARVTAGPSLWSTARTALVWLAIWWVPLLAVAAALGSDHALARMGVFFSQVAMVTFGGAYAVLAYVAQEAVDKQGWLAPGEMLDGLALAEATPGPLILVTEFVGFLGAWRNPGPLPPLVAGVLGAMVTTWATFAPCFLWIFVGAPYIEALRGNRTLAGMLGAITAAVVGVILNLAVWFSLHVCFRAVAEVDGPLGMRFLAPDVSSIDVPAVVIAIGAMLAMFWRHAGMLQTLAGSALAGILWWALSSVGV